MFLINSLIFSLKIHKIPEVSLYACYVYAVLAGIFFFLIVYVSFFFPRTSLQQEKDQYHSTVLM
jgi:hypothetical protein